MIFNYDSQTDESLARGGSFDLTGTSAKTNMQFWGFNASDGAVIETIKGIAVGSKYTTLAQITAAEADLTALFATSLSAGLLGDVLYRIDGYIITNVKLTSGSLHLYKLRDQVSS